MEICARVSPPSYCQSQGDWSPFPVPAVPVPIPGCVPSAPCCSWLCPPRTKHGVIKPTFFYLYFWVVTMLAPTGVGSCRPSLALPHGTGMAQPGLGMAQPGCGVPSVLQHSSNTTHGAPRDIPQPHRTGGTRGWVSPLSPHVAVRKSHLDAEHGQRRGAVVPVPSQQPALPQGSGHALGRARAAPALAVPPAGMATPRRGAVPRQPVGPVGGDGVRGAGGTLGGTPALCSCISAGREPAQTPYTSSHTGSRVQTHQRGSVRMLRPLKE